MNIDITSNRRRVCMDIRMEKLKIPVLAGTLSSILKSCQRVFFYSQMCGCVPCFPRFTAIFTGDVIFLGKFPYFSMKTYIIIPHFSEMVLREATT